MKLQKLSRKNLKRLFLFSLSVSSTKLLAIAFMNFGFSLLVDMKAMSAYGYEIVQTLIVDIEPDEHVKKAMNEINAGMLSIIGYIFSWAQITLF